MYNCVMRKKSGVPIADYRKVIRIYSFTHGWEVHATRLYWPAINKHVEAASRKAQTRQRGTACRIQISTHQTMPQYAAWMQIVIWRRYGKLKNSVELKYVINTATFYWMSIASMRANMLFHGSMIKSQSWRSLRRIVIFFFSREVTKHFLSTAYRRNVSSKTDYKISGAYKWLCTLIKR